MSHAKSLHPLERGFLYAYGVLQFRPYDPNEKREPEYKDKIGRMPRGHVTAQAKRFIAGEFGDAKIDDVADDLGLNSVSFRATVWKLQHPEK